MEREVDEEKCTPVNMVEREVDGEKCTPCLYGGKRWTKIGVLYATLLDGGELPRLAAYRKTIHQPMTQELDGRLAAYRKTIHQPMTQELNGRPTRLMIKPSPLSAT